MRFDDATSRPPRPTCTWVEVRDSRGRTRMEARWTVASATPVAAAHAA